MFFSQSDIKIPDEYLSHTIPPVGDLNRFIISNYVLNNDQQFIKFKVSKPFDFFDKGILINSGEYKSLIYLTKNINGIEVGRFIHFMLYVNIVEYYKVNAKMPILNISIIEKVLFNKLYNTSHNRNTVDTPTDLVVWMCPATGMICVNQFSTFIKFKEKSKGKPLLKSSVFSGLGYFPENNKVFCDNFVKDQILFICTTNNNEANLTQYSQYTDKILRLDNLDEYVDESQTIHESSISFSNIVVTDNLFKLSKPDLAMEDIYIDDEPQEINDEERTVHASTILSDSERKYIMDIALVLTNNRLFSYNGPVDIKKYLTLVSGT